MHLVRGTKYHKLCSNVPETEQMSIQIANGLLPVSGLLNCQPSLARMFFDLKGKLSFSLQLLPDLLSVASAFHFYFRFLN